LIVDGGAAHTLSNDPSHAMFSMNSSVSMSVASGSTHFFSGGANVSRTRPAPAMISSAAFASAIWMSL
jgi:hypothetical protein